MDTLSNWLLTYLSVETQVKLFQSLVIILVLILTRLAVMRLVNQKSEDPWLRYRWRKTTVYLTVLLGLLLVGRLWITGVESLATYLGLVSAGLAIALQGPVTDLAGWLYIIWRRPFEVGDRIQIGNHAGDVIDLRIFQFTLLEIRNWVQADQSTGRLLQVPNGLIFKEVVANYTMGFEHIWHEIPVLISLESDWEKAKTILQEIADKHAEKISPTVAEKVKEANRQFMIYYSTLTPTVYTTVQPIGILLTIRILTDPRQRRTLENAIWEDVLRAFAAHDDIELAHPSQRTGLRLIEAPEEAEAGVL